MPNLSRCALLGEWKSDPFQGHVFEEEVTKQVS
jgi:hypothetical protein